MIPTIMVKLVKLPVFDFITLINWVYQAVVRQPFMGIT